MGDKTPVHPAASKLSLLWEAFTNSEANSQEKEVWFDLFVAQALVQLKDGKTPVEIIALSGSNVSTLLAEDIVRGVESTCKGDAGSSDSAAAGPPDDLAPLKKFLTVGPGWRTIALLNHLGVQDVGEDLGLELCRVLMCVYGVVSSELNICEEQNEYVDICGVGSHIASSVAMDQVCRFRLQPSRHKSRSTSASFSGSANSLPASLSRPKPSVPRHMRLHHAPPPKHSTSTDSDHQPSPPRSLVTNPKIGRDHANEFNYFTSEGGAASDDDVHRGSANNIWGRRRRRIIPDDMIDSSTSFVLNSTCPGLQLSGVVLSLLQSVCRAEITPKSSTQIVTFSLEALCSLQFGSSVRPKLQGQATRLLLIALDKLLPNAEATATVLHKGALPLMLRLLEDSISKASPSSSDPALQQDFIYGVTYAVVNFVHSLVIQCPSPENIDFHTPFQQFLDSCNSRLIESSVNAVLLFKTLDEKVSLNRARKIIGLVGQLVSSLKQVRTRFVHMKSCRKNRHKMCKVSSVIHHHDDVLGDVYKQTVLPGANRDGCRITAISMSLARFISDSVNKELALRAMQALMECGTCCCFPAQGLITRILRLVQTGDSRARNTGLMLLERTIYKEVGALEERHCNVCCDNATVSKHRWAGLQAFQDMLLSKNTRVAYTVASHLMRVAPSCATIVQRELMFSVFYPAFLASKRRYCESKSDRDKFTLLTCLSAFTNLLGRMRFASEFLERDGLRHVIDLTRHRDFERLACTILEIVTIVRLWKLEETSQILHLTSNNIPELEHLISLIVNTTTYFLTSLKKWQGLEESAGVSFKSTSSIDKYSTCLEELNTYWASCLNLCLYSPQVRSHCTRHLSIHAYSLLTLFLQHIAKPISIEENTDSEFSDKLALINQLHLELLESLITITTLCPYSGNPDGVKVLKGKLEKVAEGRLGLRPVCDVLLRSSGAKPTDKLMLPVYPMPKISNMDVSLAASLLADEANSDSSINSSEDEGYDGDVELTHKKQIDKECQSNKGSLPPSRKISALGERRYYNIVHPTLCHLALDLIVHCHCKEGFQKECIYCLHKLSSAVRDSVQNAMCLVESGFSLSLLQTFSELLSTKSEELIEIQQAVLELFGYLAKYCLQPEELSTFLQFFVASNPPVGLHLNVLSKLMKSSVLKPKYSLEFPAEYSNSDLVNSTQAHKLAITLHHQHLSLGVVSCWSRSGLFLPLNCDLSWAMWVQGFSFSIWLKLHNPLSDMDAQTNQNSESSAGSMSTLSGLDDIDLNHMLHIISIGYEALVLEFWADPIKDLIDIRLTRSDSGKVEVLSEASLEGRISPGLWHHLAISVRDSVHSGKVIIEITLVVDGWCEVQVPLSFKGLLVRKSRPTCVLLGDTDHAPSPLSLSPDGLQIRTSKDRVGGWEFGTLMMLRKPVIGKLEAEYLRGIGPDACLVSCIAGHLPPFSDNLSYLNNGSNLVPSMVMFSPDTQHNILKTIQENLLMVYSAKDPNIINIYPQVSGGAGVGGGFRVVVGGDSVGNDNSSSKSSQQVPMTLPVVTLMNPVSQHHSDIISAIDILGGPAVMLFLFARVVELESSERDQATTLELFLRLATSFDGQTKRQATSLLPLVARVIDTPFCSPGVTLLQVVVECCCRGELLIEPELLVTLLLESPTPWANSAALDSLLQTLLTLLKDDHPHREFNASQLNRANALNSLLNLCKERLLEGLNVSLELCRGVVEVVRGLMTAPPLLDHIAYLFQYLILSHPAHLTFISHTRESLYFILPPHPPSSNSQLSRKKGIFDSDSLSYRSFFAKPVDASKLNKALSNLKKKKSRWHKPRKSSGESRGEDPLAPCDSGIAASSLKGNTTDSEQPTADVDEWSSTSANTYFTNNAQQFEIGSDCSNPSQASSQLTSDNDVDADHNIHFIGSNLGWRRTSISNGEIELVVGLLEVVRDQLLVLPDSVAHSPQLMASIVSPHVLIAMANHTNHHIVSAVVKVLAAYWERVNSEERARFISERLFFLLSLQLPESLSESGGIDLVEGLAGIVTGYHRSQLSHQVMQLNYDFTNNSTSLLTVAALPPLLALLPSSVTHIPTAHNLISFIHSLFIKAPDWKVMLEFGLIEVLLKCLMRVVHELDDSVVTDLFLPERNVVLSDISSLLSTVISQALLTPGSNSTTILSDLLLQVEYMSNSERESCGNLAQCCVLVKKAHAAALQSALTSITDAIASYNTRSSFLSSVMSVNIDDVETQSHSSGGSSSLNLPGKLSRSDLNERFKLIISRVTEFFMYTEPDQADDGGDFIKEVWGSIIQALVAVIERKSMQTRTTYSNVAWTNRDTLRTLGSQMFLWMLSPAQTKVLRMFAIQSILNEPRSKDILSYIISTTLVEESTALYLWDLSRTCGGNEVERKACEEMSLRLEEWCSPNVLGLVTGPSSQDYAPLVWSAQELASHTRQTWRTQRNNQINKVVYRHEDLGKEMSELAMRITREVVSQQSIERKKLMEKVKIGFGLRVHASITWRQLVTDLTHERAVFHFAKLYPRSWELDPTEGPNRVRIRLRRCQLDIEKKFFKPEYCDSQSKGDLSPMSYLFEDSRVPLSEVVVERLHSNTKIKYMCQASVITPQCQTSGELLISHTALYFVPSHHDHSQIGNGGCDTVSQEWSVDQMKEIHRRRFELQERGLEIFLLNGRTHLIALNSTKERDEVMESIGETELGSRVASEPLCDAVDLWREGHLTNWQYLMTLNTLAGRAYNDLMQYPVFPFVLSNYTSKELDLTNPDSYRNFKKPMAIQDKKNESHYIKHYNYLKAEIVKTGHGILPSHPQEPYHYSSHYSNSVTVLHFLVRLPPFTAMFLKYQDDSFDWPDRTFHSIHTTWRLTSSESTTDVKELIPEFFFLPEFLTNSEGFNFGLRQSGDPVDQVELPPWASDPRMFILIHRQALESEFARENIPDWIDLVFGYKQVGKAAVDCINVFHPATYYGFDPEKVSDPLSRQASYTMVRTYGQTPKQLFKASPHPLPVENLESRPATQSREVLPGVKGLVWGKYVGSPGEPGPPRVVWQHQTLVSSLVPLLNNDVFGLPPSTCLLLSYTKEIPISFTSQPGTCIHGAAVISWGHGDGVLRAKVRKDQPPLPIIPPFSDTITVCTSSPDTNQLWLGFASGKIIIFNFKFEAGGKLEMNSEGRRLVGHKNAVLSIYLCRNFSIAVSAATDGVCIIWDMNSLTYVRSLPEINLPTFVVTVSDTLGDISTVCIDDSGSLIRIHTINSQFVGSTSVKNTRITAACYSTAPEGASVNVLATATSVGDILLWSSWDLSRVGKISSPGLSQPIISLTYSYDSQLLYATFSTGTVVMWQGSSAKSNSKAPKFVNLMSLL